MSYIQKEEYMNILELDPKPVEINKRNGEIGTEKLIVGLLEANMLAMIISFANVDDERKNTNHACRCSNDYFMGFFHQKEKTIQRALRVLKEHNLIYTYEYKPESWLTKDRYIFPNWDYINEVCGTDLPSHEIPEYVISNYERRKTPGENTRKVKSDFLSMIRKSNLTSTPVKSDTLIINDNKHRIINLPLSSDDEIGNEDGMDFSVMEMLYAYLKYEKEVADIATNMEKNMDSLSETEIIELLSKSGFDIQMYSDHKDAIKEGCASILAYIEEDKRYEEEERRRQEEYINKDNDEWDKYVEEQSELSVDSDYLEWQAMINFNESEEIA